MRKIEREMIEAIKEWKNYRKDNTDIRVIPAIYNNEEPKICIYLHSHLIGVITENLITLKDCGYQTNTTKSRLNCILSHYNLPTIYSKKYQWFIGDEEWTGDKEFKL